MRNKWHHFLCLHQQHSDDWSSGGVIHARMINVWIGWDLFKDGGIICNTDSRGLGGLLYYTPFICSPQEKAHHNYRTITVATPPAAPEERLTNHSHVNRQSAQSDAPKSDGWLVKWKLMSSYLKVISLWYRVAVCATVWQGCFEDSIRGDGGSIPQSLWSCSG